ncbi:MAG TPA: hypothetical protein VLW08_08125, partial [Casimicrobiaceae bacterium]|nr:hypothetical protein [Casimicrobiaceae bacterium]
HPLCARRRVTWRALAGAQWVLPRKGAPTRDLFESELARRDIASADVPVETSDPAVGQARRRRPAAGGRRLTLGPIRPILRVAPGDVRALRS